MLKLLLSSSLFVALAGVAPALAATAPAAVPTPRPATHPAQAAAAANEFASFGLQVTPPPATAGWKRITEGATGMIARWAHTGADGQADALLALEMEPAKGRSAAQYAAGLASNGGGQVQPAAARGGDVIGGQPAVRVGGLKVGNMTSQALVALHGEYVYVISAFADTPQALPLAAVDALARGLRFIPLAEPSTFTALRGEKFPLFNKFLIEPLATMRPNPAPPPEGQIGVSTFNFARHRPDCIMTVQLIPNPAQAPMAQLQAAFPGKLAPGKTVNWTTLSAAPTAAAISAPFDAVAGQAAMKSQIGLVQLSPEEVVFVLFNYPTTDAKAQAAYERAAAEVVRSVAPLPAR